MQQKQRNVVSIIIDRRASCGRNEIPVNLQLLDDLENKIAGNLELGVHL